MKALILTWEQFQDHEMIYPYYRLDEEGFEVDIMSNKLGRIFGILGAHMESTLNVSELDDETRFEEIFNDYDFLVTPGGVKALEKLRQEKQVLRFINKWNAANKVIASICHGGQLLISSDILKNRDASAYYSIKDDLINAGANFVDAPAVRSGNLISCPHYKWLGPWMKESIKVYRELS